MDGQDEVINNTINNNNDNSNINNNNNSITNIGTGQSFVKGKRTKRQRPQSPIPFRMITTTNTSYKSDDGSDICSNNNAVEEIMTTATTTTTTIVSDEDENYFNGVGTAASTTEEEEDMANCLILLAQGHSRELAPQHQPLLSFVDDRSHKTNNNTIPASGSNNKFISRKFMEAPSTTGKSGYYVYECKTCGKTFSSFQALGGHRASHKKPKNKDEDYSNKNRSSNIFSNVITPPKNNKTSFNNSNSSNLLLSSDDEEPPFKVTRHSNSNNMNSSTSLSLQLTNRALYSGITNNNNSKGRVHECSICGAEFSSGQALGGHMRRHRGPVSTAVGAAAAPVIRAVPLTVEQAAPSTDMSEDIMIPAMKIPPARNNTSSSVLSLDLDLNLPAPQEDNVGDHQSKFVFESKTPPDEQQTPPSPSPPPPPPQKQQQQQQLVFSAPALVDCHY